jgi:xanthine dehydrogenase accessory factor
VVGGRSAERVLRAPADGWVVWHVAIGDVVETGQRLGIVDGVSVAAPFTGVVRGLISDQVELTTGLKIGDVDPRLDWTTVDEMSDKALAIGGGVVEAVLTWSNR